MSGPVCVLVKSVAGGGGGGGVQGVQLNPPSKLMIFMTIVVPWKNCVRIA